MIVLDIKFKGDLKWDTEFKKLLDKFPEEIKKIQTECINKLTKEIKEYTLNSDEFEINVGEEFDYRYKRANPNAEFAEANVSIISERISFSYLNPVQMPPGVQITTKKFGSKIYDATQSRSGTFYFSGLGTHLEGVWSRIKGERTSTGKTKIKKMYLEPGAKMARSPFFETKLRNHIENCYDNMFNKKVTDLMSRMGIR